MASTGCHFVAALLCVISAGCQSDNVAGSSPKSSFPQPPTAAADLDTEPLALPELNAYSPTQQVVLKAVAEAVTATEHCPLIDPGWPTMSQAIAEAGVNADEAATTAALDAVSAAVAEPMRNQRTGAICDQAIAKYGPGGSEAPDYVTLRTEARSPGSSASGERRE